MSTTFEVHVQAAGRWRLASVFDDRENAIAAAKDLAKRPTTEAVRVAYEAWDAAKQEIVSRTVYRSSRQQEAINAELERAKERAVEAKRHDKAARVLSAAERTRIEQNRRRATRKRLIARMVTLIILVSVIAVGTMYAVKTMARGGTLF